MSVRPVTRAVPEATRGLRFYQDSDNYDALSDDIATGDPYNPEWPSTVRAGETIARKLAGDES